MDAVREVDNPKIIALLGSAEKAGECTNRPLDRDETDGIG
jgi:hypothetical protein